jgi:1-acyl-sn-glycerol-3-phosphate acyltransferase
MYLPASLRAGSAAWRTPAPVQVVWSLRHLRDLRHIDWSDAGFDRRLIEALEEAFAGLHDRYFRMEIQGWEHVSRAPVLVVANHSGFGVAELLMLLVAWYRHHGGSHPAYVLAHRWLYKTPFLRVVVPKLGGVEATWAQGSRVLRAGHPLFVFPGGEEESTRPFSERYRVMLHGRRGFVRLALAHDVPIVPCVTIGSHATMILPPGMHALAVVTGARRYLGLRAVPLPLQMLVWALAGIAFDEHVISGTSLLLLLLATPPLYPSKITTRFGRMIAPAELSARAAPGESPVDAGYRHVERVMQGMMDDLAEGRRSLFE